MSFPEYLPCFSLKSLKKATNNFATLVRWNGFSYTYIGTLVDGSRLVVQMYYKSRYWDDLDFTSMIQIMSTVKHKNLVELIGYCVEDGEKMLVCDFFGQYSLNQYLFSDSKVVGADLNWPQRVSICHGIARVLDYLQNEASSCVVLRDVQPSNVFIDSSFNPKIIGFEVASILEEGESHRSAPIAGTHGYLDPECFCTGRYSKKMDVYAFGITLLEIISGKKNSQNLICLNDWAWELRESGRITEIVDPTISEFIEEEVIRVVCVVLSCVQLSLELKPSVSQVRLMLSDGYDMRNLALTRGNNEMRQLVNYSKLTPSKFGQPRLVQSRTRN